MIKTYDNDQLKAINANHGRFLVLAPPGCGKTDILAERVVRAHAGGISLEDMMCLTFTNRASRGMRDRIREKLGEDASGIFVGNVHRYCSNLLFANALVPENTGIIDEDDFTDICLGLDSKFFSSRNGSVNKTLVNDIDNIDAYIEQRRRKQPEEAIFLPKNQFESLFQMAKNASYDPDRVGDNSRELKYALQYRKYKDENHIISFTDILILAYEALRKDTAKQFKRYKWIQIDEVQDLNALQTAIVDEITDATADYTVLYLGDEQQAIFSFLGAKLGQLERLKLRCGSNILHLGTNYRSPKYLLDIFNTYAQQELGVRPDLLPKPNSDDPHDKFDLILTGNRDTKREHERILGMIKHYLGFDNERLAILVPTNKVADMISESLSQHNIPHFKISGTDMFRTKDYKTLAAFFCLHANPFNYTAWARLIYGIDAKSSRLEARQMISRMKQIMMTPADLLRDIPYVDEFNQRYLSEEFVFFDTETTGLNVLEDDIVQIAAFKVRKGQIVPGSDFNIIMHTDKPIPDMLGDIPNPLVALYGQVGHLSRMQGIRMFVEYIGNCPVLGHNVDYDYQILRNNVMRELNEEITLDTYDSLRLIKCVQPYLRMYKLEFLLKTLNLQGKNSHLANEDIMATKYLVDYCVTNSMRLKNDRIAFCGDPKNRKLKTRMEPLKAISDQLKASMNVPVAYTFVSIVDQLKNVYNELRKLNYIQDLGAKFDLFLAYAQNEWVNPEKGMEETLCSQILTHVNDMTASINEGDLINTDGLMTDRIFVMTVHKGKGLEFENVVVLSANDGVYPFFWTNNVLRHPYNYTEEEVEKAKLDRLEDARKFYVALSRAKKRLCVSYVHENEYGFKSVLTPFMKSIAHLFYGH